MGQRLSFSALFQFFYSYPLRPPGGEEKKTRRRGQPGGASSIFPLGLIPSVIICNYPLRPPGGASEGPVVGNLRFPPRGPSLQPPPESPFPFRVERLPVRPASSCSNKSFAFGTLGLADTGSHGGATKLNASFSPFPPYNPAEGLGGLRSCPHPGNPSGGGPGYARRVTPLA